MTVRSVMDTDSKCMIDSQVNSYSQSIDFVVQAMLATLIQQDSEAFYIEVAFLNGLASGLMWNRSYEEYDHIVTFLQRLDTCLLLLAVEHFG